MRIGLGAMLLVQVYILWVYRDVLLDPFGPVPWALADLWVDPWLPRLSHGLPLFARLGLGAEALVATALGLHALAAAFLMIGYRTRVSAVLAWATFVLIKDSSPAFFYGVGSMMLIALFYSMLMPVGREWSVDRMLARGDPAPAGDPSFSVLVLRMHLCIIYAAAGLTKAAGEQWWSGEALWRALSVPQFRQFDPSFLLAFPGLLQAAAVFVILAQAAYPILVWTRARAAIVVLAELMHVGIAVFLGLWMFSGMMIVLNTGAFGEAVWRALATRFDRREAVAPAV
jgi:hypothetical protein